MPETSAQAQEKNQLAGDVFSSAEKDNIRQAIRKKYADVSSSAAGLFKYPTGREGALRLGYDVSFIADIPSGLLSSFCGVGNPFAIAPIAPKSRVLDIGCGAGLDLIVAARTVGDQGSVCGVDISREMLDRAEKNLVELGLSAIDTVHVDSEKFPFEDGSFDVVISNGVINLSPNKPELFAEIRRLLKPKGRLQFADIVLDKELPPSIAGNLDAWAQ